MANTKLPYTEEDKCPYAAIDLESIWSEAFERGYEKGVASLQPLEVKTHEGRKLEWTEYVVQLKEGARWLNIFETEDIEAARKTMSERPDTDLTRLIQINNYEIESTGLDGELYNDAT